MVISVLIVDDSKFFRDRIADILKASDGFRVAGEAEDGYEAIEKARTTRPDVITMDYEMPKLDGVSAVKEILSQQFIPILMFSSLTYDGARITLDALEAGAIDFLPKNFGVLKKGVQEANQLLIEKIRTIAKSRSSNALTHRVKRAAPEAGELVVPQHQQVKRRTDRHRRLQIAEDKLQQRTVLDTSSNNLKAYKDVPNSRYRLLILGASTGGPVALQTVLGVIPDNFPIPIAVIQHMPASFTKAFAHRLDGHCRIEVREAKDREKLEPGLALLAPGGSHMMIANNSVQLVSDDDRVQYRPSLDICFGSAAKSFSDGVLAVVLTGMGFDGTQGARLLKERGSSIWTQDEESSVIYGMPWSVKKSGLSDLELSLHAIGHRIVEEVMDGST